MRLGRVEPAERAASTTSPSTTATSSTTTTAASSTATWASKSSCPHQSGKHSRDLIRHIADSSALPLRLCDCVLNPLTDVVFAITGQAVRRPTAPFTVTESVRRSAPPPQCPSEGICAPALSTCVRARVRASSPIARNIQRLHPRASPALVAAAVLPCLLLLHPRSQLQSEIRYLRRLAAVFACGVDQNLFGLASQTLPARLHHIAPVPGNRIANAPFISVVVAYFFPVSVFVAVTATPGRGAGPAFTVPVIVPPLGLFAAEATATCVAGALAAWPEARRRLLPPEQSGPRRSRPSPGSSPSIASIPAPYLASLNQRDNRCYCEQPESIGSGRSRLVLLSSGGGAAGSRTLRTAPRRRLCPIAADPSHPTPSVQTLPFFRAAWPAMVSPIFTSANVMLSPPPTIPSTPPAPLPLPAPLPRPSPPPAPLSTGPAPFAIDTMPRPPRRNDVCSSTPIT